MTDAPGPSPLARPRWLLPTLIVFTVICALLLVPAAGVAITAPMMSDSGVNAGVWILMIGGMLAPLVVLISPIVAWVGYALRFYHLATVAMCGPLAWLLYMIAAFVLVGLAPLHR